LFGLGVWSNDFNCSKVLAGMSAEEPAILVYVQHTFLSVGSPAMTVCNRPRSKTDGFADKMGEPLTLEQLRIGWHPSRESSKEASCALASSQSSFIGRTESNSSLSTMVPESDASPALSCSSAPRCKTPLTPPNIIDPQAMHASSTATPNQTGGSFLFSIMSDAMPVCEHNPLFFDMDDVSEAAPAPDMHDPTMPPEMLHVPPSNISPNVGIILKPVWLMPSTQVPSAAPKDTVSQSCVGSAPLLPPGTFTPQREKQRRWVHDQEGQEQQEQQQEQQYQDHENAQQQEQQQHQQWKKPQRRLQEQNRQLQQEWHQLRNMQGKTHSQEQRLRRHWDNTRLSHEHAQEEEQTRPFWMVKDYCHAHVPKTVDLAKEFAEKQNRAAPTTLMIRNIPNRCTQIELVNELEYLGFAGTFDFLYIPLDKGTLSNVGYAFVNFSTPQAAAKCMTIFKGYRLLTHRRVSAKLSTASVAHIQGLEANLRHYENSAVKNARVQESRPIVMKMPL